MRYLVNSREMKQYDKTTVETYGIPSMVLMERAALAFTEAVFSRNLDTGRVLVVCGGGNNGGDGYAVARLLWQRGSKIMENEKNPIEDLKNDEITEKREK